MLTFIYNGVESSTVKVFMRSVPNVIGAEHEYDFREVEGRDGTLTMDKKRYRDFETDLELYLDDEDYEDRAISFLQGSGDIIFSKIPNRRWHITFVGPVVPERILKGMRQRVMTIPVRIQPCRYIYPDASNITITSSGVTITNPGTYFSLPKVTITGSGDITLTIGADSVHFESVSGGIVVDSKLMDALSTDGTELLNDKMDGEPWRIQPGTSLVSWEGNVTRVVIEPRWRCL